MSAALPISPPHHAEPLTRSTRVLVALGMLGLHVSVVQLLFASGAPPDVTGAATPIVLDLVVSSPPRPASATPPPRRATAAPSARPVIRPVIASSAPAGDPAPSERLLPAAASAPVPTLADPRPEAHAPAAETAAIAPAAPAPARGQPPTPREVSIRSVEYLTVPVLHYPVASRRMQEEGRVDVRVLVDATGAPRQMQIVRPSGYPRLDDAALAAVRATRFKPYSENGTAMPFWVVMPLIFELES